MKKQMNKYYRWRRNRIRNRALERRKSARVQFPYPTSHMTSKERDKYFALGHKWYKTLGLSFGTDVTGLNLSKVDLNDISDLPGEKEYKNKTPRPVEQNPIVVTFTTVTLEDGREVEVPLWNGNRKHPIYGEQYWSNIEDY